MCAYLCACALRLCQVWQLEHGIGHGQETAPNGDAETYVYDALNRAAVESAQTTAAASLFEYDYAYDAIGNVGTVAETYPSGLNNRLVTNTYDKINRLQDEAVTGNAPHATTTYGYDAANNRTSKTVTGTGAGSTTYTYNQLNQLTGYSDNTGRAVALGYDLNGNRTSRVVSGGTDNGSDTYSYDIENRLTGAVKGSGGGGAGTYAYGYDYRTRRITRDESAAGGVKTQIVFSGGTSVQEYDGATSPALSVEYIRGSDYGGGVGGILYTCRGGTPSYTHENKRGDVVAKTDGSGSLTYQAQYEGFGKQVATNGSTLDRQKSNSKDTDPTGLVCEGFRYRDLETGMFITRDPAGFVDGPNLYTYVVQNPWTKFDPEGLMIPPIVVAGGAGAAGWELGPFDILVIGGAFLIAEHEAQQAGSSPAPTLGSGSPPTVSPPPPTGGSTTSSPPASATNPVAPAPAMPTPTGGPGAVVPPPSSDDEKPPGKGTSTEPGAQSSEQINKSTQGGAENAPPEKTLEETQEWMYGPENDPKVNSDGSTGPNTWTTRDSFDTQEKAQDKLDTFKEVKGRRPVTIPQGSEVQRGVTPGGQGKYNGSGGANETLNKQGYPPKSAGKWEPLPSNSQKPPENPSSNP